MPVKIDPSKKATTTERETSQKNVIFNSGLTATKDNRFCTHCHVKLVNNPYDRPGDKYIYKCPLCGVISNIHDTEPTERLVTTFPIADPTKGGAASYLSKRVLQSDKDKLSRSQYFISKNAMEKNKTELNDPYLVDFIRKNNKITITNIDYHDPTESDY